MTPTASLLVGALLGAANAAAALWAVGRARTLEPRHALRVVLGGMVVRMVVVLGLFGLALALLPLQRGPFVAGLGVLFVLGLFAEAFLLRQPRAAD